MLRDWMKESDRTEIKGHSYNFINKTVSDLGKIVLSITDLKAKNSFLYRTNSFINLMFLVINVVLTALSQNIMFLMYMNLMIFILMIGFEKDIIKRNVGISITASFFTAVILIFSFVKGNYYNSGLIVYKVFLNILIVNTINTANKTEDMIKALKNLHIPDIFIWIMEISVKYIILLCKYTVSALEALKIRSVGKIKSERKAMFGIMGNIFLNSMKMSEEMSDAMECRGFSGEYKRDYRIKLGYYDVIMILIEISIIFIKYITVVQNR